MSDDVLGANAQGRLKSIVERIERLEEDKAAVLNDIKEVFAEAKGEGFDVKILRKVVRLRKQDKAKRQEEAALLDLYLNAIEGPAPEDYRVSITGPGGLRVDTSTSAMGQLAADLDLYERAVEVVVRDRKASTSYVQRRLQLGYNKAASLMERMEREGVVSRPDQVGKRQVLREPAHD